MGFLELFLDLHQPIFEGGGIVHALAPVEQRLHGTGNDDAQRDHDRGQQQPMLDRHRHSRLGGFALAGAGLQRSLVAPSWHAARHRHIHALKLARAQRNRELGAFAGDTDAFKRLRNGRPAIVANQTE